MIVPNLRIGIIRHAPLGNAEQRLIETARSRGHSVEIINPFEFTLELNRDIEYDVIITRAEINSFTSEETDAYLRIIEYFEQRVPVINTAQAILNAQDKFRTHLLVAQNNIPTPNTFLVHSLAEVRELIANNRIQFPFVVKTPYGGRGEGVFLVENQRQLREVTSSFNEQTPILVQEFINLEVNSNGDSRDMRIWVCRNPLTNRAQFIGGIYRNAPQGQFLTNISQNGYRESIPVYDNDIQSVAEAALEAIGADVAGLDLMRDQQGNLYLLEINICFDIGRGAEDIIGANIWDYVLDLAESRSE